MRALGNLGRLVLTREDAALAVVNPSLVALGGCAQAGVGFGGGFDGRQHPRKFVRGEFEASLCRGPRWGHLVGGCVFGFWSGRVGVHGGKREDLDAELPDELSAFVERDALPVTGVLERSRGLFAGADDLDGGCGSGATPLVCGEFCHGCFYHAR